MTYESLEKKFVPRVIGPKKENGLPTGNTVESDEDRINKRRRLTARQRQTPIKISRT